MRDDNLPKSGVYILNLDDKMGPGTHWVCIYNNEYFDSYGLPPPKKLNHLMQVSTIRIQPENNNLCGLYACAYIMLRNANISAYDICYT